MKRKLGVLSIFAALFICSLGMTAFASSGKLTYGTSAGKKYAQLTNTSSGDRYCSLSIYKSNQLSGNRTLVRSTGGVLKKNGYLTLAEYINTTYAFANGYVYNSAAPTSGVAVSYHKRIK